MLDIRLNLEAYLPALYRLELDGCISSSWGLSENNRKAKYYKITARRKKGVSRPGTDLDAVIGGRSPGARQMISPHKTSLKLLRRRRLHADLEAELAHHRELTREHGNAAGLGNTTAAKESALDLWRFTLLENAWRNLLFASRGLRRNPAFTITAYSRSRLGIGVSLFGTASALSCQACLQAWPWR